MAAIPARAFIGPWQRETTRCRHCDALQCRFCRTLLRVAVRQARYRLSRLEHTLSRRGRPIHSQTCACRHCGRREVAAQNGRRRNDRAARQFRRRLVDGGLSGRSGQTHSCGKREWRTRRRTGVLAARSIVYFAQRASGATGNVDNWMDASVVDETDPTKTDATLDPFNPDNGTLFAGIHSEISRSATRAQSTHHRLGKGGAGRAQSGRNSGPDISAIPDLGGSAVHGSGYRSVERPCPACYAGSPPLANRNPLGIGRANTLRAWLSMWSLETSHCRGEAQLAKLELPSLVIQSLCDTGSNTQRFQRYA